MLQEVVIVEGKSDIQRVQQALEVECIATEGFALSKRVLATIAVAYEKRGIIILTDPDTAGERIRRVLSKKFPKAQHAFVAREDAFANHDIGIEQASLEAIRKAFATLRVHKIESSQLFSMCDLWQAHLSGAADSVQRRSRLGALLGIGYGNSKQFLFRLNHYGVTRDEFKKALETLDKELYDDTSNHCES